MMRLKLRDVEENYYTGDKKVPHITYTRKELYLKSTPHGIVDLGNQPELEETIRLNSFFYESLWEQYGSCMKRTINGVVQRTTQSHSNLQPDLSKLPADLTDLLKKLPLHVRKVVGEEF